MSMDLYPGDVVCSRAGHDQGKGIKAGGDQPQGGGDRSGDS